MRDYGLRMQQIMSRIDYYNDPKAPRANSLIPGASAIVVNAEGEILLHRRSDNQRWALPGGVMDIGENISETVIREVKEETGLDVTIEHLVGIYSNPQHVFAFSDGEVRQEFSICFACIITGGELRSSEESLAVAFFSSAAIENLAVHPSIRLRIEHYLENRLHPVIA